MDIETFSNIVAIAEHKSISKAANHLFVSRSALNRQLLAVEKELGMPLFKRVSNTLELTYAGEIFIKTAHKVNSAMRDCSRYMQDVSGNIRGKISVGLTNGRASLMMKDLITKFHEMFPHVSLSFYITNSDELRELLYMGKVDIALIAYNEITDDFLYDTFPHEEVVLICNKNHPLAHLSGIDEEGNRKPCKLEWFKNDVFGYEAVGTPMRSQTEQIFTEQGFRPDTVIEISNTALLMQLACEGICCTVFSERHLTHDEDLIGFSFEPRRFFKFTLAYRKDFAPTLAEEYLLTLLKEFFGHYQ